jgi:hypothetical protein
MNRRVFQLFVWNGQRQDGRLGVSVQAFHFGSPCAPSIEGTATSRSSEGEFVFEWARGTAGTSNVEIVDYHWERGYRYSRAFTLASIWPKN